MGKRTIRKFFENFRGLDLRSSDLTRPDNFALTATNIEIGRPFDIRKRKGFKPASQRKNLSLSNYNEETSPVCAGIFSYEYFDSTTGAAQSELLGVGKHLYRQKEGRLNITLAVPATSTFEVYSSGSAWVADLKTNGTSEAGFPFTLGDGETTSFATLEALRLLIDNLANYTCTLTPWALVNGNQTGAGVGTPTVPITVFAGHTVSVGDRLEVQDQFSGAYYCRDVIGTTATTITLKQPVGFGDIDVSNNQPMGVGVFESPLLGRVPQTSCLFGVASVFRFSYWEKIYTARGDAVATDVLFDGTGKLYPQFFNYQGVSKSNVFYIAPQQSLNDHNYSLRQRSGLIKYDGQEAYGADLPPAVITSLSVGAGAGLSTGDYKYLAVHQHIDAKGNVTISADNRSSYVNTAGTDPKSFQNAAASTTAGNNQVTLTIRTPQRSGLSSGSANNRNYLYALVNGPQAYGTGSQTITVLAHSLRIGDTACFIDRTNLYVVRYKITGVTNTTITINVTGLAGSVVNGDTISNNLTVKIYRTKVGGNVFYFDAELPMRGDNATATISYLDTKADTALFEQYEDPGDFSRDPAPVLSFLSTHQGLLVGGGSSLNPLDPTEPNTVYWSNPGEDLSWTISSNAADVATGAGDFLTCCASDTENMLAVFSAKTYTNITGDLATGAYSIDTAQRGDVGCPAPNSLQKIRDTLFYCSTKGFRALSGGKHLPIDDLLISRFQNIFYYQLGSGTVISTTDQTKLYLTEAVSVHDVENQRYICSIPADSSVGVGLYVAPNANTRTFVFDYANNLWSEWQRGVSNASIMNMFGGACFFNNNVNFVSAQVAGGTTVYYTTFALSNYGTLYDYMDNCFSIPVQIQPQWQNTGDPSIPAQWGQFKVWALNNTLTGNNFSWRIKTYLNYLKSVVDTDKTISFVQGTDIYKTGQFKLGSATSLLMDFSDNTVLTCPIITGWEYTITDNYRHDNFAEVR